MCVPKTTVENIKTKYNNTIIKKGNEEIKTGNVGTGYKVIIEEKDRRRCQEYTDPARKGSVSGSCSGFVQ